MTEKEFSGHDNDDDQKKRKEEADLERSEKYARDLSGRPAAELTLEILDLLPETSEFLQEAKLIVNSFAGAAAESQVFLEKLDEVGNSLCKVVAVDLTPLNTVTKDGTTLRSQLKVTETNPERFQYEEIEVVKYLEGLPDESIDLLTAFGSDDYFLAYDAHDTVQQERQQKFHDEVKRVLKPAGIVSLSYVLPIIEESDSFEKLEGYTYRKK